MFYSLWRRDMLTVLMHWHGRRRQRRRRVLFLRRRLLRFVLHHFAGSIQRIHLLFRVLDDKANGSLTFDELRAGLMKFRISPPILVSRDDWDAMTENRRLTDGVDELSLDVFEMIMRKQMKLYVQRKLCNALQDLGPEPGQIGAINFAIKLLLIAVDVCNDHV